MILEKSAPCEFLPWDSDFFGCRIGRVRMHTLDEDLAVCVDAWAVDNRIRGLYLLARSDEPATVLTAENHGYRLVDVRMTFERTQHPTQPMALKADSDARVRPVRYEDVPSLQEMARTGHNGTRFSNDPHFPRERVEAFYSTWIALECQGRARQVLVAASINDEPLGYVSCHLESNGAGQIGLVGVSQNSRGKGVGFSLVGSALRWFDQQNVRHVTVVTQGNNLAAQRLYQKCGFLTREVQLWYHKWFS